MEEIGQPYELEKFLARPEGNARPGLHGDKPQWPGAHADRWATFTITESTAIAQYLAAKYAPALAPGPEAENFAEYLQWLHYAEGMIMPPVNNYVVETILLPPDRRNDEIAMRALKLLNRTLAASEAHMEGREFLAGGFTIADTITGHAVIMARRLGADFSNLPNLSAYADRLEARPAFQAADAA